MSEDTARTPIHAAVQEAMNRDEAHAAQGNVVTGWLVVQRAARPRLGRRRRMSEQHLCPVCLGEPHPEYMDLVAGVAVPGCPRVPGNSRDRYLGERRECAARGVMTTNLNDVVFDDLLSMYGTRPAIVEALCADPRPRPVTAVAGPRFTTEQAEWIG